MSERKLPIRNAGGEVPSVNSLNAELQEAMGDFCDAFVFIETALRALDADRDRTFPELPYFSMGCGQWKRHTISWIGSQ